MIFGCKNAELTPLGASAGFAEDETPSTKQDADSRATEPKNISTKARITGALNEALIIAP